MTPNPDTLIAIYRDAYLEILHRLATKELRGNVTDWERALLADVAAILSELDTAARTWIEGQFATVYLDGQEAAIRELVTLGARPEGLRASLTGVHRAAVETLANQLHDDLRDAHGVVGRRVEDLFRDAGIQAVTRKTSTGQTIREAQARLRTQLADQGVAAFVDKAGKEWRLDSYSAMAIRTTVAETQNVARINQQSEMGYDLLRLTEHHPTCSLCSQFQGRVYSISGNDPRFPALYETAFAHGYHTIHANCAHRGYPVVEALADDFEALQQFSSRPFEDQRSIRERNAYADGQRRKRQSRDDRRQWERYSAVLPDDTPAFSAFRRMKSANSERWQELQSLYRDAREQIH